MATIFTKIAKGEIPSYKCAESDDFYAFLDISPLAAGHTLVIPKNVEDDYIFHLDEATYAGLWAFARKVAVALKDNGKYDDTVDAFNDMIEDMIDDLEGKESVPKFDKIVKKQKLTKAELKNAEQYFVKRAEKYGAKDSTKENAAKVSHTLQRFWLLFPSSPEAPTEVLPS